MHFLFLNACPLRWVGANGLDILDLIIKITSLSHAVASTYSNISMTAIFCSWIMIYHCSSCRIVCGNQSFEVLRNYFEPSCDAWTPIWLRVWDNEQLLMIFFLFLIKFCKLSEEIYINNITLSHISQSNRSWPVNLAWACIIHMFEWFYDYMYALLFSSYYSIYLFL